MNTISTVGVVGAGTMGAALAQKFAQEGFTVVLLDRTMALVERGVEGIARTLHEAVERRIFSGDEVDAIMRRITPTEKIDDLANCDLVIEAIFENMAAKTDLLRELSRVLAPDAIVGTNTSSFSVGELARSVTHPERFCGMHYFYHAAKNRLVELIAGDKTSAETMRAVERFAFLTGKDPIICRDRYGFAVNRFFVPWLNEAVRLMQEGVASIAAIDVVCMNVFGIDMGPFALMNATGVPIAYHSQRTLESFGAFYAVADALKRQADRNEPWDLGDASVIVDEETERKIQERMLGAVFLVCGQILEEDVCTPSDLNRGARIGLKWRRGPVDMMRAMSLADVERLVRGVAARYQTAFPPGVRQAFGPLDYVSYHRAGHTGIITIERPEDLNALNAEVVAQLEARFEEAEHDDECASIVLTGTGKAFVAGADISLFLDHILNGAVDRIIEFTEHTQQVFDRIDRSDKPVLALVNGMAFGGGLELALCADRILALPGARFAFPETGLGIYPGLGGTQRTQQRIGKGLTKYLIYTGDLLTASAAADMGLIDGLVSNETFFAIQDGMAFDAIAPIVKATHDARWQAIADYFGSHSLDGLLGATSAEATVDGEDIERWRKRVLQKAPIALHAAERLVDEARGPRSELEYLPKVFLSNDALVGLSSFGRKVTFSGS